MEKETLVLDSFEGMKAESSQVEPKTKLELGGVGESGERMENKLVVEEDSNKNILLDNDISYLESYLTSAFEPIGLEPHPFLIGWYNEKVGPKFHLNYPEDTLAYVVISGPGTFEQCIIPYVQARLEEDPDFVSNNVLDDSMKHAFTIIKSDLKKEGFAVDAIHDFDLYPSKKPKVLVQTAAHVAGVVQYLHKRCLPTNIQQSRFEKQSNLSGVAIHPKYGGWYAIRGVIVSNVRVSNTEKSFQRPEPVEIFTDLEKVAQVLELFAYKWQTNEWRNMHEGNGMKYSDDFMKYLSIESDKRWEFVRKCCSTMSKENESDICS